MGILVERGNNDSYRVGSGIKRDFHKIRFSGLWINIKRRWTGETALGVSFYRKIIKSTGADNRTRLTMTNILKVGWVKNSVSVKFLHTYYLVSVVINYLKIFDLVFRKYKSFTKCKTLSLYGSSHPQIGPSRLDWKKKIID